MICILVYAVYCTTGVWNSIECKIFLHLLIMCTPTFTTAVMPSICITVAIILIDGAWSQQARLPMLYYYAVTAVYVISQTAREHALLQTYRTTSSSCSDDLDDCSVELPSTVSANCCILSCSRSCCDCNCSIWPDTWYTPLKFQLKPKQILNPIQCW